MPESTSAYLQHHITVVGGAGLRDAVDLGPYNTLTGVNNMGTNMGQKLADAIAQKHELMKAFEPDRN